MTISLYISKRTDMALFAYFTHMGTGRSTLIKELLRDYIHHTKRARLYPLQMSFEECRRLEKKAITIPITLHPFMDKDIIDYLSDCPKGAKSCCIKSILGYYLTPYVQSLYHQHPVPVPTQDEGSTPLLENMAAMFSMFGSFMQQSGAMTVKTEAQNVEAPELRDTRTADTQRKEQAVSCAAPCAAPAPNLAPEPDFGRDAIAKTEETDDTDALLDILCADFG